VSKAKLLVLYYPTIKITHLTADSQLCWNIID